MPLIYARQLCKQFGAFTAVDAIDFDVAQGEAFGFLGPNGAGKSSTMRMIGCVSPVSGGGLRILGMDPDVDGPRIRARLGVVPQEDNLDLELTVRENLLVYGRYFDLSRRTIRERAERLLEFSKLTDRADDKVDPLSGGMKRRLTIARSLINEPDILLLDEPTTGLDPQARHVLWDRLYRLKQQGVTLVLTTLMRGLLYGTVFLGVMVALGDVVSPWAILALPASVLIGFAFAATGMAATTFMRSWQDFDFVQLAVLPLFLFSGTFYPLSTYPGWLRIVVQCSPLYQGVALVRGLTLGMLGPGLLHHAVYLAVMGLVGLRVASRRLGGLLLT